MTRAANSAMSGSCVTSTTVMANLPAADEAGRLAERCPELGLGIHLTLTEGFPASPASAVPTLVDADGRLLGRESLLARLRAGQHDDLAISARAQWALDSLPPVTVGTT